MAVLDYSVFINYPNGDRIDATYLTFMSDLGITANRQWNNAVEFDETNLTVEVDAGQLKHFRIKLSGFNDKFAEGPYTRYIDADGTEYPFTFQNEKAVVGPTDTPPTVERLIIEVYFKQDNRSLMSVDTKTPARAGNIITIAKNEYVGYREKGTNNVLEGDIEILEGQTLVVEAYAKPSMEKIIVVNGQTEWSFTYEAQVVIEEVEEVKTEDVPFKSETIETDELPLGETQVSQEGVNGIRTIVEKVTYTDGVETNRVVVSNEITTEPINEVTLIGTFVPPEPEKIVSKIGPQEIVSGDESAGFYGLVSTDEFGFIGDSDVYFNGETLAEHIGITQGEAQDKDTDWAKMSFNGKTIFAPLRPIRHSIDWLAIYRAGAVYGTGESQSYGERIMLLNDKFVQSRIRQDASVIIQGQKYIVRLFRMASSDPVELTQTGRVLAGNDIEYSGAYLPLSDRSPWRFEAPGTTRLPNWGTNLPDGAFGGQMIWGQEYSHVNNSTGTKFWYRMTRGNRDISDGLLVAADSRTPDYGWKPVLELVEESLEEEIDDSLILVTPVKPTMSDDGRLTIPNMDGVDYYDFQYGNKLSPGDYEFGVSYGVKTIIAKASAHPDPDNFTYIIDGTSAWNFGSRYPAKPVSNEVGTIRESVTKFVDVSYGTEPTDIAGSADLFIEPSDYVYDNTYEVTRKHEGEEISRKVVQGKEIQRGIPGKIKIGLNTDIFLKHSESTGSGPQGVTLKAPTRTGNTIHLPDLDGVIYYDISKRHLNPRTPRMTAEHAESNTEAHINMSNQYTQIEPGDYEIDDLSVIIGTHKLFDRETDARYYFIRNNNAVWMFEPEEIKRSPKNSIRIHPYVGIQSRFHSGWEVDLVGNRTVMKTDPLYDKVPIQKDKYSEYFDMFINGQKVDTADVVEKGIYDELVVGTTLNEIRLSLKDPTLSWDDFYSEIRTTATINGEHYLFFEDDNGDIVLNGDWEDWSDAAIFVHPYSRKLANFSMMRKEDVIYNASNNTLEIPDHPIIEYVNSSTGSVLPPGTMIVGSSMVVEDRLSKHSKAAYFDGDYWTYEIENDYRFWEINPGTPGEPPETPETALLKFSGSNTFLEVLRGGQLVRTLYPGQSYLMSIHSSYTFNIFTNPNYEFDRYGKYTYRGVETNIETSTLDRATFTINDIQAPLNVHMTAVTFSGPPVDPEDPYEPTDPTDPVIRYVFAEAPILGDNGVLTIRPSEGVVYKVEGTGNIIEPGNYNMGVGDFTIIAVPLNSDYEIYGSTRWEFKAGEPVIPDEPTYPSPGPGTGTSPTSGVMGFNNVYLADKETLELVSNEMMRMRQFFAQGNTGMGYDNHMVMNPHQYIINTIQLPFRVPPEFIANRRRITLGFTELFPSAYRLNRDRISLNLGQIYTEQKYNNSYDFANTEIRLHLPYTSPITIEPAYAIGQTISIEYLVDVYTGMATVNLRSSLVNNNAFISMEVMIGNEVPFISMKPTTYEARPLQVRDATIVGGIQSVKSRLNNNTPRPFVEVIRHKPYEKDSMFNNLTRTTVVSLSELSGRVYVHQVALNTTKATLEEESQLRSILSSGIIIS